MKENSYQIGDIIACKLEKYGIYFPCQVIKLDEKQINWIAILVLNSFLTEMPKIENIRNISPLYRTHHFWKDEIFAFWIETKCIKNFSIIGNKNLIIDVEDKNIKNSNEFDQVEYQYLWQQLPDDIQKNFKNRVIFRNYYSLDDEALTRNELEDLKSEDPYKVEMKSQYFDDTLRMFLEENPLINKLSLSKNQPKIVDISKTAIQRLTLEIDNVEEIVLNKNISYLFLHGDFTKLRNIKCPFNGKYLFLELQPYSNAKSFPVLKELETLRIDFKRELDIRLLSQISENIKKLYIMGDAATITNLNAITVFNQLEFIWFSDVYGFTEFPSKEKFPNLEELVLWSIPKVAGDRAKKEYAKYCKLEIKQLRTEEWIKANLDNPLRVWDGREDTPNIKAKKAMKAYSDAYKKLSKKDIDKNGKLIILKEFLAIFNKIEEKYHLDTLEVEEIVMAFNILGTLTEFTEKNLEAIFEENLKI